MPFEMVAVSTVTGGMKNCFDLVQRKRIKVNGPTRKTYATGSDQKLLFVLPHYFLLIS